jgi:hypothetical protein
MLADGGAGVAGGKEEDCPLREHEINSISSRHSSYILEVSVVSPLDLAFLKRSPGDIFVHTSDRLPQLPTVFQKTSLLHPCVRVPKWDAIPERQVNY